jgi:hypothetical protein
MPREHGATTSFDFAIQTEAPLVLERPAHGIRDVWQWVLLGGSSR